MAKQKINYPGYKDLHFKGILCASTWIEIKPILIELEYNSYIKVISDKITYYEMNTFLGHFRIRNKINIRQYKDTNNSFILANHGHAQNDHPVNKLWAILIQ